MGGRAGARSGLDFAGKHLMRAGIVVLGLKVSVMDVLGLGWQALLLITGVVLAEFRRDLRDITDVPADRVTPRC